MFTRFHRAVLTSSPRRYPARYSTRNNSTGSELGAARVLISLSNMQACNRRLCTSLRGPRTNSGRASRQPMHEGAPRRNNGSCWCKHILANGTSSGCLTAHSCCTRARCTNRQSKSFSIPPHSQDQLWVLRVLAAAVRAARCRVECHYLLGARPAATVAGARCRLLWSPVAPRHSNVHPACGSRNVGLHRERLATCRKCWSCTRCDCCRCVRHGSNSTSLGCACQISSNIRRPIVCHPSQASSVGTAHPPTPRQTEHSRDAALWLTWVFSTMLRSPTFKYTHADAESDISTALLRMFSSDEIRFFLDGVADTWYTFEILF